MSYRVSLVAVLVAAALSFGRRAHQGVPSTDIYLAPITISDRSPTGIAIGSPSNITRRVGYDNQPAFGADESGVFFTSIHADGQADIYRYDIASKQVARVTTTTESEYSPTLMPGGRRFSVIRVEPDSAQRLWSFTLDGRDPQLVVRTIKPVGYHAWLDATHVAVYVLGKPATLQVVDLRTEHADTVARNVDRSLSTIAAETISFVQQQPDGGLMLERLTLDAMTGSSRVTPIAPLPAGAAFVVWTAGGVALTGAGTKVYALKPGQTEWALAADLAGEGLAHITRLALSANGHWLALVADDGR